MILDFVNIIVTILLPSWTSQTNLRDHGCKTVVVIIVTTGKKLWEYNNLGMTNGDSNFCY